MTLIEPVIGMLVTPRDRAKGFASYRGWISLEPTDVGIVTGVQTYTPLGARDVWIFWSRVWHTLCPIGVLERLR